MSEPDPRPRRRNRRYLWFFGVLLLLAIAAVAVPVAYNRWTRLDVRQIEEAEVLWHERAPRNCRLEYRIRLPGWLLATPTLGAPNLDTVWRITRKSGTERLAIRRDDGTWQETAITERSTPMSQLFKYARQVRDDWRSSFASDWLLSGRFDPRDGHPITISRGLGGPRESGEIQMLSFEPLPDE